MLALFALIVVPLDLGTIPLDDAARLDGRLVVAAFTVGLPVVPTDDGRKLAGPADRDDIERVAVLPGERLDLDQGDAVTVVGVVRVILHPTADVMGVPVPEWVEIRVEGLGIATEMATRVAGYP